VHAGEFDRARVAGKIVIVGSTNIRKDSFITPLTDRDEYGQPNRTPGFEVWASAVQTALEKSCPRFVSAPTALVALIVTAVVCSVVYGSPRLPAVARGLLLAAPLAALAGLWYGLFAWRNLVFNPVPFGLVVTLSFISGTVTNVFSLLRANAQIQRAFGRYVSDAVLKRILESPDSVIGVERRRAAVLFSDLRNFTGMSEGVEPELIAGLLNRLYERMVGAIYSYGGTVDKFVGDEIMAVFGVPFSRGYETEVRAAVRAGIAMQRELDIFNHERLSTGMSDVRMGVGVHAGVVVAGNIGSKDRLEYTVIGDTVNTAARIQGVTKADQVFLSREVWELVKDEVAATPTEPFTFKHKSGTHVLYDVAWRDAGPKAPEADGEAEN
jgi:class 3 adenylate cyclase